jgi:hypothetical protein
LSPAAVKSLVENTAWIFGLCFGGVIPYPEHFSRVRDLPLAAREFNATLLILAKIVGNSGWAHPFFPQANESGMEGGWCYWEVWNSMFSSTESWAGVPDVSSPERVATTRKPPPLVWTS